MFRTLGIDQAMPKGLDVFCGAGGSSAGARAAGIELVAGIDMSSLATETYSRNFPRAKVITDRLEIVNLSRHQNVLTIPAQRVPPHAVKQAGRLLYRLSNMRVYSGHGG
jgi:site-specific DNA-cytosine methylase